MKNLNKETSLLSTKRNFWVGVAIVLFFNLSILQSIIHRLLGLDSNMSKTVATFICYVPIIIKVIKTRSVPVPDFVIIMSIVIVSFGIGYIAHPEYSIVYSDKSYGFFYILFPFTSGIFGYYVIRLETDPKKLLNYLRKASIILFIWYAIRPVETLSNGGQWISGMGENSNYSMLYGYQMLFPTTILLFWGLYKHKAIYLCMGVLGAIEILVFGSRGPLLCIAIMLVLYILRIMPRNVGKIKTIGFVFMISAITIVIFNTHIFETVVIALIKFINNLGLQSRTLTRLLTNEISDDTGRSLIWNTAKELINHGSFWGYGPLGDIYLIGTYSHNIFLELFMTYGIPFGGVIILLLIYYTLKMLIKCNNIDYLSLYIIFFSYCFGRLLLSYSFWYETTFWAAIGIIVSYSKSKKFLK